MRLISVDNQNYSMSEANNLTLHEALNERDEDEAVVYAGIDHGYMIIDESDW